MSRVRFNFVSVYVSFMLRFVEWVEIRAWKGYLLGGLELWVWRAHGHRLQLELVLVVSRLPSRNGPWILIPVVFHSLEFNGY